MKERFACLIVGILVGGLVVLSLPSNAHHNPELRRLKNRVADLEDAFSRGCSFGDPVTWGSSLGNPVGDPTLRCGGVPAGDIDTPAGCSGDAAIWTSSGLDC